MLAKRIIPCLDVDKWRVVKGVQFFDHRDAGDVGADITVANESMDAYLGFPVWDALTFPAMHVADIRELSEVQVMRFSPNDADELRQGGAEQKLRGIRYGHFGAFMKRAWRENDYLWGRLDGVEHALKLLNPPGGRLSAAALQHASVGWRAVLKNEDGRLPRIRREMAEIRDEIP